jgi:hypothetical protein
MRNEETIMRHRTRLLRTCAAVGAASALLAASPVPAAGAGPGPGHDKPNVPGINVMATAGPDAAISLTFTGHTDRNGAAHGSITYRDDDVRLRNLQLERLALVTEEEAIAHGCSHGEIVIARGYAYLAGVGSVRVWVDLQDRPDGDLARVRLRTDHADHHGGHGMAAGGPAQGGHDDEDPDGHDDGHGGGHVGGWLYRSHWQPVSSVDVHVKGYQR